MKVAWILDNINTMNGMVRVVIGLSNFFVGKGYNVEIVSVFSKEASPFFALRPEINVRNLGKDWRKLSRFDKHRLLREVMKKSNADIMLTCNEWANSSSVLNKGKFTGKLVITQHMSVDGFSFRRRLINGFLHRFADKVVVLTEADYSFYRKFGIKNIIVIPNAIYTDTLDLSNKKHTICAVGRVEEAKGFDMLITAFAQIAEKVPDWKLRIIGDGTQRVSLISKINELGLAHQIEMPGMSHAVAEELAQSSIYTLSSRWEGLPLTMLEAMNSRNAIVAFGIPCVKEILTSESALIVPPENVEELAAALLRMISDADLREKSSFAAYTDAQKYTVESIGEKWINLFDNLINMSC